MTPGAKARKHKRWLYEHKLGEDFRGSAFVALINLLKDERAGRGADRPRLPEHQLAYDRLMMFMPEVLDALGKPERTEAYRMVLKRAWKKLPLACFDEELFAELSLIVRRSSSMLWRDVGRQRFLDIDLDVQTVAVGNRQMTMNFNVYEDIGIGIVSKKALDKLRAGPTIQDILTSTPLMRPNVFSMGCKVTP
jgi:hypothetical protein